MRSSSINSYSYTYMYTQLHLVHVLIKEARNFRSVTSVTHYIHATMHCLHAFFFFISFCAVPEEFDYNSQTGKHGDRSQKMEIKRSSVEYIAPSEYMVRRTCMYMYDLCECVYTLAYSQLQ